MSKREREKIRHLTLGEKGEKELTYEREEAWKGKKPLKVTGIEGEERQRDEERQRNRAK
jgi:hypothetical protein